MSENNFKPFYSDPWNIMDLVVVVVSLVAIPFETDPQLKTRRRGAGRRPETERESQGSAGVPA
eukprot:227142-Hanusia_phi.AAC.1